MKAMMEQCQVVALCRGKAWVCKIQDCAESGTGVREDCNGVNASQCHVIDATVIPRSSVLCACRSVLTIDLQTLCNGKSQRSGCPG
jgi:hypothetical protein